MNVQTPTASRHPDQSAAPQIYTVNPAAGSYFGGETVVLTAVAPETADKRRQTS